MDEKEKEEQEEEKKDKEEKNEHHLTLYFNIGLHENLFVHLLLMFLVNFFTLSAVMGLFGYGTVNDLGYYILSIVLFTLVETTFKIITFTYIPNIVIRSLGAINLSYLIPMFYLIICLLGKITFADILEYFIVLAYFFLGRLLIMHYIKRISFRR